ncbi:hypothetical protein ES706_03366 [subsurface metagenome]
MISDKVSLAHSASSVIASEAKQSHAADGGAGKRFERFLARRAQNDTEGVKTKQDD